MMPTLLQKTEPIDTGAKGNLSKEFVAELKSALEALRAKRSNSCIAGHARLASIFLNHCEIKLFNHISPDPPRRG